MDTGIYEGYYTSILINQKLHAGGRVGGGGMEVKKYSVQSGRGGGRSKS
jgi:hypothetical protein